MKKTWKRLVLDCIIGIAAAGVVVGTIYLVRGCSQSNTTDTTENTTEYSRIPVVVETETVTETEAAARTVAESESEVESETDEPLDLTLVSTMYTTTSVNVRVEPNIDCDIIVTLYPGKEVSIYDYDEADAWSKIILFDNVYWICSDYIADEIVVTEAAASTSTAASVTAAPSGAAAALSKDATFHYYGIWAGQYWHFTPEEIDNQWAGQKTYKAKLEEGTTRAWQLYLYQKLSERGFAWWYKYACAQAMQESGFNPLADNGVDYGLFSFRLRYWDSSYGDVYDYHANINAYVDRISKYLVSVETDRDLYMALSQHYNPNGALHMDYVNSVLGRLNELWICD